MPKSMANISRSALFQKDISGRKRDKYLPLLDKGLKTRSIGSTASNENSSRSHAIFRVTIARMSLQNDCDEQRKEAKLSLVDLAGKVF